MHNRKNFWLFLLFIPALMMPVVAVGNTGPGIDLAGEQIAFRAPSGPLMDGPVEKVREAIKKVTSGPQEDFSSVAIDDEEEEEDDDAYEWHRWGKDKDKRHYDRFHGMGGFIVSYQMFNSDDLDKLADQMGVERLDGGMVTFGGYGMGYVGRGWYIGGGGFGGYTRSTGVYVDTNGDSYNRELGVGFGGGGFMFEYAPLMLGPVNVGAGALVGGGGLYIRMIQDTGIYTWDDLSRPYWDDPVAYDAENTETEIDQGFFLFQPYVSARIKALDWMGFSASVGYNLTAVGEGKNWYFNETEIKGGGPDLTASNVFYRVGVIFGG